MDQQPQAATAAPPGAGFAAVPPVLSGPPPTIPFAAATPAAATPAAATPAAPALVAKDPAVMRREAIEAQLLRAEQAAREKRFHEALGICQDVLEANPGLPSALAVAGAVEGHRGDLARATGLLEQAVAKQAGVAAWHGNLSGLYRVQYRLDEAIAAAREAVRLRPDQARNHVNLGKVLTDRGDQDAAILAFYEALARDADNAEAHLAIGQILLSRGDMRPGWVEYDWRNRLDQAKGMLPKMVAPEWNGMALPRHRLLLVGDQGYGDTLQFCRYIPRVARLVGEVVIGCSPDLEALLGRIQGVRAVRTRWADIPRHAAYALMSSLPAILGTSLDDIPADIPYLHAEPAEMRAWEQRLAQLLPGDKPRVGLVWAGRSTHPNDARRSLRLEVLAPLAQVASIDLVSLQKVVPKRDAELFAAMAGKAGSAGGMLDIADQLSSFAATAAAVANLDLVVTVDSAVAHLAGGLGRPTWVMVPSPADWRWLLDRADSPWYPTLRLFRQARSGDWAAVIAEVVSELGRLPRRDTPAPG